MSTKEIPSAKQGLRGLVVEFFPWLAGIVYDTRTKDLVIKAAGKLLCLMGGPDDPRVHRVGDAGIGGTVTIQGFGPSSIPASTVVITYIAPDGTPSVITITGLVTSADFGPFSFTIATKATTGSDKVTCA